MSVAAIIQARMGSTRLPGKVLQDLAGEPMLSRVVKRVRRAQLVDEVVVATTDEPQDGAIIDFCRDHDIAHFAGSHHDVLDRYYQAAKRFKADTIVRITSDCPLIDPNVIDIVIRKFRSCSWNDYVSSIVEPRTFPRGLDTEVFSIEALEAAWRESTESACREHVTQYFLRNPNRFEVDGVYSFTDHSALRWTVDTSDDMRLAELIFEHCGDDTFSWKDVINAYDEHPEWRRVNAHVEQKKVA